MGYAPRYRWRLAAATLNLLKGYTSYRSHTAAAKSSRILVPTHAVCLWICLDRGLRRVPECVSRYVPPVFVLDQTREPACPDAGNWLATRPTLP